MRYVTPALRVTECPRPRPVRRKVANIKCELLNDFASANRARRAAVLADDAALELDLDIDATRGEDASGACAAAALTPAAGSPPLNTASSARMASRFMAFAVAKSLSSSHLMLATCQK